MEKIKLNFGSGQDFFLSPLPSSGFSETVLGKEVPVDWEVNEKFFPPRPNPVTLVSAHQSRKIPGPNGHQAMAKGAPPLTKIVNTIQRRTGRGRDAYKLVMRFIFELTRCSFVVVIYTLFED